MVIGGLRGCLRATSRAGWLAAGASSASRQALHPRALGWSASDPSPAGRVPARWPARRQFGDEFRGDALPSLPARTLFRRCRLGAAFAARFCGLGRLPAAERRPGAIRRRIAFEPATWHARGRLAKDRMETIQELADEAFRDLLKKHRRPTTLKEMLRESLRSQPANDHDRQSRRRGG